MAHSSAQTSQGWGTDDGLFDPPQHVLCSLCNGECIVAGVQSGLLNKWMNNQPSWPCHMTCIYTMLNTVCNQIIASSSMQ
jgi:hypothetical protein